MLLALANFTSASAVVVGFYQRLIEFLFDPPVLPTIIPRAIVLALLLVVGVLAVSAFRAAAEERSRRRLAGGFWWRLLGSPLGTEEPGRALSHALWTLVRGASSTPVPFPSVRMCAEACALGLQSQAAEPW